MGADTGHSIFESIILNLKKIQESLSKARSDSSDSQSADNQLQESDLKQSMGLHRRLLDHEVESINSELINLVKNKDSIEYLISLIQKREKISHQINKIESKLDTLDSLGKNLEKGVS